MSTDSPAAALLPSQKEPGQSTKDFKRLQRNKRRKLHNAQPQKTEQSSIHVPPSTDMSLENTRTTQGSRASPTTLESDDERETSSAKRTWIISEGIGGRFINADPLVTRDGQYIILAQDNAVKIFSIETSLMVRRLKVPNSESICAYGLSTAHPTQVYAASSAGPLYHWDWPSDEMIDVSMISPGAVDLRVLPFELTGTKRDAIFSLHSESTCTMKAYRTPKNSLFRSLEERIILNSKSKLEFFQVANDGKLVAIAAGSSIIIGITETLDAESLESLTYVWRQIMVSERIHSLTLRVRQLSSAERGSFSASGIGLDIAIGGETGVISVFDNALNNLLDGERAKTGEGNSVVPRRMHWHREPVNAIHWSADGEYIISGGREAVLVLWQLDTGKRQFLPHMSSTIERLVLSSSGTSYTIKLGNNSVVVLSTGDLKPVASISGIQSRSFEPAASRSIQRSLHLDPGRTGHSLIVPSTCHPSNPTQLLLAVPTSQQPSREGNSPSATFLQTYDILADQHVSRQALTRTNTTNFNVGPEGTRVNEPDIKHVVASIRHRWLVSIDEWAQPEQDLKALHVRPAECSSLKPDTFLKIWSWSADSAEWSLVTRIDNPHSLPNKESARVLDIVSHPADPAFASIGEDGVVRFWAPKPRRREGVLVKESAGEDLVSWACVEMIRLGSAKQSGINEPSTASLAYSTDGSVLAVSWKGSGAQCKGTVFLVDTLDPKVSSVRNGLYEEGPVRIGFVEKYLIILSEQLRIYDTVNDTLDFVISLLPKRNELHDKTLFRSLLKLAIHPKDKIFAVAVPCFIASNSSDSSTRRRILQSQVALFDPTTPIPLLTQATVQPITSLTAIPAGFAMIDSALNVRVLTPPGALALSLPAKAKESPKDQSWVHNSYGMPMEQTELKKVETDVDPVSSEVRESPLKQESDTRNLMLGDDGMDNPGRINKVQLTSMFDLVPSYAMPPVSQLFERVAGLVARRL